MSVLLYLVPKDVGVVGTPYNQMIVTFPVWTVAESVSNFPTTCSLFPDQYGRGK